ncbi:ArsR/SmtB family transcription factor [Teichococcus vastitatis]|jgi:ArsR family transcriptional regulator|uniref:Metalloregulator ArsR/SmtB family transcription factor n=1 Tax=Teichococcus vastitatis TaxID=2307076 RepID=A0ABS9WCL0_9PROT|nr:metalloregulator ArsR/SmtB family transcription factor [Pseudoroseomonas vastitatis]MCI0756369.1 metalloregulator ArsR/SmtB family transcription factor [Pseudoroseomonas vastitatis]
MQVDRAHLDAAAGMFKALSDPARLQTLVLLALQERSVGELAEAEGDRIGTVSARLQVLLQARLVRRRKEGKNAIYSIADAHVLNMVENAIQHADEHHH